MCCAHDIQSFPSPVRVAEARNAGLNLPRAQRASAGSASKRPRQTLQTCVQSCTQTFSCFRPPLPSFFRWTVRFKFTRPCQARDPRTPWRGQRTLSPSDTPDAACNLPGPTRTHLSTTPRRPRPGRTLARGVGELRVLHAAGALQASRHGRLHAAGAHALRRGVEARVDLASGVRGRIRGWVRE